MINFKAELSSGMVTGDMGGTVLDMALEVCMIIQAVYIKLGEIGDAAEQHLYKSILKKFVADESVFQEGGRKA